MLPNNRNTGYAVYKKVDLHDCLLLICIYIWTLFPALNVLKEHIQEIFSTYGKIKMIDMPLNRIYPHLSKCYAYVEYETPEEAEKALKHMDGGAEMDIIVALVWKGNWFKYK